MLKLTEAQLDAIRPLGTSLVAEAIDGMEVRLRNEGFISGGGMRCMTPKYGPIPGYAVTARIRSVLPPMQGSNYAENFELASYVTTLPKPRVMVLTISTGPPASVRSRGGMHRAVEQSLECIEVVTDGAVRDLTPYPYNGVALLCRKTPPPPGPVTPITEFGGEEKILAC